MPLSVGKNESGKWLRLFGCWLLLLACFFPAADVQAASADDIRPPELSSAGAILMDGSTGQVLYEKQADQRFYPASITKILTAIVAMENGQLDDVVTVSEEAVRADGTRVYLVAGEQKTLRELLYAMMVNSGNDAAVAIAEHIAGSVENFAVMMNQKAADLGAVNSHFVNPSGLHEDNHYTTARDMAVIAQYAMRNPLFRQIVETKTMPWNGDEWQSQLVNHNKLLWQYEGATGVKNGYTSKAKQTFVATAKKGDIELVAVCLQAPSQAAMYNDLKALLDYGFNAFAAEPVVSQSDRFYPPHGTDVALRTNGNLHILRPINGEDGKSPAISTQVVMEDMEYPISKGQQVGQLHIALDGRTVIQATLYAAEAVVPPAYAEQTTNKAAGVAASSLWLVVSLATLAWIGFTYFQRTRFARRVKLPVSLDRRNTIQ